MSTAITHVAVYAADLERTKTYYETFFEGKSNNLYKNAQGFSSYFISFDSGVRLEIMHHTGLEKKGIKDKVTGWSHIAFSVGSRERVIEMTDKITASGFKLYSLPRQTGDGYFESCVADPDGNRVEITQ
jgi:lactoylglutathione lyase